MKIVLKNFLKVSDKTTTTPYGIRKTILIPRSDPNKKTFAYAEQRFLINNKIFVFWFENNYNFYKSIDIHNNIIKEQYIDNGPLTLNL